MEDLEEALHHWRWDGCLGFFHRSLFQSTKGTLVTWSESCKRASYMPTFENLGKLA